MRRPLEITFHNVPPSEAVEAVVREKAAKLERFHPSIMGCHVTICAAHRRHTKGNTYDVHLNISLPGRDVIVNREPGDRNAHEDLYVAIRDSFDAARRQLEDRIRIRRHKVKQHELPTLGKVIRLHPKGFGFLQTQDGREIYFHKNSVIGEGFDALQVGETVRFLEEQGDNGPQASTVRLL